MAKRAKGRLVAIRAFTSRFEADAHAGEMRRRGYSARPHERDVRVDGECLRLDVIVVREKAGATDGY